MTIRGIGFAAADGKWQTEKYPPLFEKLTAKAGTIEHLPSQAIAYTYIAMAQAFERLKIVIEPGGTAALAAALRRPDEIAGDAVLVLATGGNVDRDVFLRALHVAAG